MRTTKAGWEGEAKTTAPVAVDSSQRLDKKEVEKFSSVILELDEARPWKVHTYRELIRTTGYPTPKNLDDLAKQLAKAMARSCVDGRDG